MAVTSLAAVLTCSWNHQVRGTVVLTLIYGDTLSTLALAMSEDPIGLLLGDETVIYGLLKGSLIDHFHGSLHLKEPAYH